MTDFTRYRSALRDKQDHVERGVWGELTYVPGAGSMMSVRGTGTLDEELPVVNFGYSFNLSNNANAEVIMLSLGSDVNNKVALPVLPRDVQHQWAQGAGGVQSPSDGNRRLEFNGEQTWLKDGTFVYGHDKAQTVTIDGNNVTVTLAGGNTITVATDMSITVGGALTIRAASIDFQSATLTHNGINIGSDHTHSGVDVGGGNTGEPN